MHIVFVYYNYFRSLLHFISLFCNSCTAFPCSIADVLHFCVLQMMYCVSVYCRWCTAFLCTAANVLYFCVLQEMNVWREYDVDAFVIVYSITDRRSYTKAVDLMFEMRKVCEISTAVILVANKADLVRARTVTEEGVWLIDSVVYWLVGWTIVWLIKS